MEPTPPWIIDYALDCRRLWGIGDEWRLTVNVVDHPNGDSGCDAACWPDATYLRATIEIARDVQNDEIGRHILFHEMMHIAMADLDRAVGLLLDAVPKKQRRRLREYYESEAERFIQRTTRAMARQVQPTESEV